MMKSGRQIARGSVTAALWGTLSITVVAQPPYTTAQANAGEIEFDRKCAECHEPLDGFPRRAPALFGADFEDRWRERPVRDLFVRMRDGMPPAGVRPTGDGFTNVLAYLLRLNGQSAGTVPLDPLSYEPLFAP